MVAGERQRLVELAAPGRRRLAWARIDQVEREARELALRQRDRGARLARVVLAAEEFERAVVERLDAERQPIDAGGGELAEARRLDRGRIGFERDLDVVSQAPVLGDAREHGRDGRGPHQGWRAAAE